jgi:glycosyltransferase involved in cell wall biosynthesis
MVLEGTYPPDVRVRKEARALADDHELSLLCLGDGDDPDRETVEDLAVRRFEWTAQSLPARAVNRALYLFRSFAPLWYRRIDRFAADRELDVLHVHDLPLVGTAMRVADDRELRLVADLHENYPAAVRQYRAEKSRPDRLRARLLRPISRVEAAERAAMAADAVLTPVEEGREHYLEDCDADPDRVHVVGNTVDLSAFDLDPEPADVDGEFVVSYVGSFGPHRGLETLVDAMPALARAVPEARLLLVGSGSDRYERSLRERVAERGVADRVTFTGWVDFEDVPGYVAASDVCTVTHRRTEHTETTVPHKLFQYMALARPVLVTDVGPLGRVVRESDCGAVIADGDSEGAAEALTGLAEDPERARTLGVNGQRAVHARFNWARDAERLRAVYRAL